MKYPKPQKGNRCELTIRQHTFPSRSLSRFTNSLGVLTVRRNGFTKVFKLKPDHPMFCARRTWDQRAERGYMKAIEDEFQTLAEQILAGLPRLNGAHHRVITRFYALWRLRTERKYAPLADLPAKGVTPDSLTQDQQEALESTGYLFVGPDGMLPGRMLTGLTIQRGIHFVEHQLAGESWGIARAHQGEFLLPDQFGTVGVVPLSPTACLVAGTGDHTMLYSGVQHINRLAISASREYVLARSFGKSPL
jgi:hypothetical protein